MREMKDKVKKVIIFRFDQYKDIEIKLEKMAAKGLFLEVCGTFLWTFRKDKPQKLKYTITYFSEGSLFNPGITINQQTYLDYAKAADWNFVTQFNQMQIFCSEVENPVPFETDEREKFENIKKCMKKNFLPSMITLILVFFLNLLVLFNSFKFDPIDFLSDANRLFPFMMIFTVLLYYIYSLIDYLIWCKRSDQSLARSGECIENTRGARRIVDAIFLCYLFGSLGWFLLHRVSEGNWFILFIAMVQIPILSFIFCLSIKYLKKKKASAMINRIISYTILAVATFAYIAFITLLIIRFDFNSVGESGNRTDTLELSHPPRDELPLTCEDLYGQINYDYYSYEKTVNSTIFLTKSSYRQDSLPAKDSPPQLDYEILEPQFDFVYDLAKKHYLEIPEWWDERSIKPIDNEIFGTVEAYQEYYDDNPTGKYFLLLEDKIIMLNLNEPATSEQITVMKEKLEF